MQITPHDATPLVRKSTPRMSGFRDKKFPSLHSSFGREGFGKPGRAFRWIRNAVIGGFIAIAGLIGGTAVLSVHNARETQTISQNYYNLPQTEVAKKFETLQEARTHRFNPQLRQWAYQEIRTLSVPTDTKLNWFTQGLRDPDIDTYRTVLEQSRQFLSDLPASESSSQKVSLFKELLLIAPHIKHYHSYDRDSNSSTDYDYHDNFSPRFEHIERQLLELTGKSGI